MGQPSYRKRRGKRLAVSCTLDYRTLETPPDQELRGSGQTVDISSTGVLFTASHELHLGQSIELSIAWPLLRYESVPVTLAVVGVVVRTDAGMAAVDVKRRTFVADPLPALGARTTGTAQTAGVAPSCRSTQQGEGRIW